MTANPTIQVTHAVRHVMDGNATFLGMSSRYHVPAHLEPILRTALKMRREVRITIDRNCDIHAAELMPPPPWPDQLRDMAARVRMKLIGR